MDRSDRFWPKVEKTDGCWLWRGARTSGGYGLSWNGERWQRAHRVAFELSVGPIPAGMYVLHACDNPPCVRPDHLRVGSQRENMHDMGGKGRHFTPFRGRVQRGSLNENAKLDEERVRFIRRERASGRSIKEIAADLGVHRTTVNYVLLGRTWRHVR